MTQSNAPASLPGDELRRLIGSAIEANKKPRLTISFVGHEQNGKRLVRGRLLLDSGSLEIETSATCHEDAETTIRACDGANLFLFGTPAAIEELTARSDHYDHGGINIDLELIKEHAFGSAFTFKATGEYNVDVMLAFK